MKRFFQVLQRMKGILVAALFLLAFQRIASGQGTVNFSNFGGNPITYDPSVPGKNGANVEVNAFSVALYWGPLGSTEAQLTQIGANGIIAPFAGFFLSGTRTTDIATPELGEALFQVKAWSVPFGSY